MPLALARTATPTAKPWERVRHRFGRISTEQFVHLACRYTLREQFPLSGFE